MSSYQILRNCIILSILLHLLFGLSANYAAPYIPKKVSVVDLVENDPQKQSPKNKDSKSFVRQATAPDKLKLKEKRPAKFFSQEDQTVLEEQRAAQSGMTENRTAQESKSQRTDNSEPDKKEVEKKREQKKAEKKSETKSEKMAKNLKESELTKIKPEESKLYGDVDVKKFEKESEQEKPKDESVPMKWPQVGGFGMRKGSSTVGETLPQDIRIGDFTALNTDRFTYYTFFARMEEVFRPRWINYVKAAVYTYQQTQRRTREEEFVTQIELLLDKDGNFIRGILHQGSGNEALDLAPVRAFRDAMKFPNPPQEMLKDDNYIHLDYQFTVHFVPQYIGTAN